MLYLLLFVVLYGSRVVFSWYYVVQKVSLSPKPKGIKIVISKKEYEYEQEACREEKGGI